jgi:hypothetical protein
VVVVVLLLLLQEPSLLALSKEQQRSRLDAVAEVFRLPEPRARELAAQRPQLLTRSREDLKLIRQQITSDMARNIMDKGTI